MEIPAVEPWHEFALIGKVGDYAPDAVSDAELRIKYAKLFNCALRYKKRASQLDVIRERAKRSIRARDNGAPYDISFLDGFIIETTEEW